MRRSFIDDSSDDETDDMPYHPNDVFTIVVLGDKMCGKTSFINRLRTNTFSLTYQPTRCIQAHHNVSLGDVRADLWEIPSEVCARYNTLLSLRVDAVVVLFNSDDKNSFDNSVALWKSVRDAIYAKSSPEMWIVDRGITGCEVELCHPDRYFRVDSMTSDGFLDLTYDMRTTLLAKH